MTATKCLWLTRIPRTRARDYEIIDLLATGCNLQEVSNQFGISDKRVIRIMRDTFNLMIVEAPKLAIAHPFKLEAYPHLYMTRYRSIYLFAPNKIQVSDVQKEKEFVLRMLNHIRQTFQ